jgi:DNA-binding GntR family transcriptional regulator
VGGVTDHISRDDRRHLYQQAADIVRDRIRSGCYSPGQDIPSMWDLSQELNVSELTIQRAYYQLRDQGWLVINQGHPTRVATQLPADGTRDRDYLLEQARALADQAARLVQTIEAMSR